MNEPGNGPDPDTPTDTWTWDLWAQYAKIMAGIEWHAQACSSLRDSIRISRCTAVIDYLEPSSIDIARRLKPTSSVV